MRLQYTVRYDAAPEQVFAMLGQPAFREKVCKAQRATACTATVEGSGDTITVTVDQRRPAEGIPSFARKFVGDSIHIVQREVWAGSADASLQVSIPGKPGHLDGAITLRPEAGGTVQTVTGELKVPIPLVGGKLEVLIAELLERALHTEERIGAAWLSGS